MKLFPISFFFFQILKHHMSTNLYCIYRLILLAVAVECLKSGHQRLQDSFLAFHPEHQIRVTASTVSVETGLIQLGPNTSMQF